MLPTPLHCGGIEQTDAFMQEISPALVYGQAEITDLDSNRQPDQPVFHDPPTSLPHNYEQSASPLIRSSPASGAASRPLIGLF